MKIDFVKTLEASAPYIPGTIYFESNTSLIKVATATNQYRVYGGVRDASYDASADTLTIQNGNGDEIYIDFSQYVNQDEYKDDQYVISYALNELNNGLMSLSNDMANSLHTIYMNGQYVEIEDGYISLYQANADWNATSGVQKILNKPDLSLYMTLADYEQDEMVIAAAFNDINDRLKLFEDSSLTYINTINTIKVNGSVLTPDASKAVNILIPDNNIEIIEIIGEPDIITSAPAGTFTRCGELIDEGKSIILRFKCTSNRDDYVDFILGTVNGGGTNSAYNEFWFNNGGYADIGLYNDDTFTYIEPGILYNVQFNGVDASVTNGVASISATLDQIADGSTRKLADYLPLAGGTMVNDTNTAIVFPYSGTQDFDNPGGEVDASLFINYCYLAMKKYVSNIEFPMTLGIGVDLSYYQNAGFWIYDIGYNYTQTLYRNGIIEYKTMPGMPENYGSSFNRSFTFPDKSGQLVVKQDLPTDASIAAMGYTKNALRGVKFNGVDASVTNGVASISATIPSTLDQIADGTTRKLSDYLPLDGGSMNGGASLTAVHNNNNGRFTQLHSDGLNVTYDGSSTVYYMGGIQNGSATLNLPTTSGTLALTSQIPTAVTEATVSGWGFTKNTGTLTGVKFNNTNATVANGVATITATIPAAANNATITIQKGGTNVDSFTVNASSNKTINIPNELPTVSATDNGKILRVVSGAWSLVNPNVIYSGSGTPSNSMGNDGDIYLQS